MAIEEMISFIPVLEENHSYSLRLSGFGQFRVFPSFYFRAISAHWRCHRASLYYKRLKRGAIVSQTRWRGTIARRELRKLKMAAELDARRTEVLSNAAKTIQRRVRTHCARKRFIALWKAAIYIQALWRGRLACKKFEGMKREAGAIKIQKHVRRYEARKAYKNLHVSALLLQTGLRAIAAHKEYRFKLQTKAATIIQASVDSERPRADEIKEETQKKVEQLQESLQRLEGNMPLPIESTSAFDQIIQRKGHAIDMDRMPMKRTLPVSNRLKPRGRGRSSYENYTNQCLTMHQPWASLLIYGIKRIEGRSWPAPIRGRLWIHAASKVPEEATIKAMEDFYREIYAVNGTTDIKFPERYPVSRLLVTWFVSSR
ncbi:myosin-9-like isoform X2 [Euphorbia lathyris]|uniref:myosin-9-like isoform X2 n=1 Tax=Euphorbia lathyris TaxID=212925 RepID=UPI00331445C5